jgi:hypothetical protein
MQDIILPSLAGALLAISWYWIMDLLPPFRAARRTMMAETREAAPAPARDVPAAPAPVAPVPPVEVPAPQPEVRGREGGVGIGLMMIAYIVAAAALAKRQQARRIAVLQTGPMRTDIPALQAAFGPGRDVTEVSVEQALQTRYDLLLLLGDEPGVVPASLRAAYDISLSVEDVSESFSLAVGTPRA